MAIQEPQVPDQGAAQVPEGAPADSGQAPAAPAEATPAPADSGPSLTFEVDGEQHTVTQAEASQHFLRQQDYTRKTQALAEQREALSEAEALRAALEANPAETVAVLQEAYQLTPQQAQQVAAEAQGSQYIDPEDQWKQRVDGFISQSEQAQLQQQVEYELQTVEQEFGQQNVDRNLLIAHAIENNIPNLRAAQADLFYEQARQQHVASQQQQEAAILQQKRAAQFVEGGHSPAAGSTQPGAAAPVDSVRAAYDLAKRQGYG